MSWAQRAEQMPGSTSRIKVWDNDQQELVYRQVGKAPLGTSFDDADARINNLADKVDLLVNNKGNVQFGQNEAGMPPKMIVKVQSLGGGAPGLASNSGHGALWGLMIYEKE
jgi:hypothetical protein